MIEKNNGSTNTFLKRLENWIAAHRLLFLLLVIAFIFSLFLISEGARTARTVWERLEILLIPAFLAGSADRNAR